MSNTRVKFIQTTSETLDSIPVRAGTIYFVTDTQKIYMDNIDGTRTEYSSTSSSTLPAYGVCDTGMYVADKVVTVPGFQLETGCSVRVKFENGNGIDFPTLNINSTGAKEIRFSDHIPVYSACGWDSGQIVDFTYDGEIYIINSSHPTDLGVNSRFFVTSDEISEDTVPSGSTYYMSANFGQNSLYMNSSYCSIGSSETISDDSLPAQGALLVGNNPNGKGYRHRAVLLGVAESDSGSPYNLFEIYPNGDIYMYIDDVDPLYTAINNAGWRTDVISEIDSDGPKRGIHLQALLLKILERLSQL